MKKIGSIVLVGALAINLLSVGSLKASTKSTTPMEPWRYAKKTANYQASNIKIKKRKITKTKVQYNNGKITICGKAVRCNKVSAKYNGKLKKVKVKSNKFKVTLKYKKAKDITLYGLNKKGEKISTKKVVKKSSYISEKPEYIKITRDDKGITYEFQTEPNSVILVSYKKEKLQKVLIDSSYEMITIKEDDLKGKKGNITFTQTTSNKRVSEKVKLPIINKGETVKKNV